ncbi:hypothetical protein BC829DRAFT_380349 [Chytridium lagenaria]|nr:hypothetical protein BC829DRAFT_380349 [Chytridium lagenaria]
MDVRGDCCEVVVETVSHKSGEDRVGVVGGGLEMQDDGDDADLVGGRGLGCVEMQNDEDDADLVDMACYDFLKPYEGLGNQSEVSDSEETRYDMRERVSIDYKDTSSVFGWPERKNDVKEDGTLGISLSSLFKERKNRLKEEKRIEKMMNDVWESSDDESHPRKRPNTSTGASTSYSPEVLASYTMRVLNEATNFNGHAFDDRVVSMALDGMSKVVEGRVKLFKGRKEEECRVFEGNGGVGWGRVCGVLKDAKRGRSFLVSGKLSMIMRRRALPKELCVWLFRKACLDCDDEAAEASASALYKALQRLPLDGPRELFEGCMVALGVEPGILGLGGVGEETMKEKKMVKLEEFLGEIDEKQEEEMIGVCKGVWRGVGLYATSLSRR